MAKKDWKEVLDVAKKVVLDKRFQIGLTIVLFLVILISSTGIRLSNLPILKDQTNGETALADLDALYFLRLSEVVASGDNLSGVDNMRAPGANIKYLQEVMPYVIVGMYNVAKTFDSTITLKYVDAVSPALFYGLGLIIFFFLIYVLTKSKTISILSSVLLAYSPAYLFRTMAGVSDHDSIGMVGFFAVLLVFTLALKKYESSWKQTIVWGIVAGLFSAINLAVWAGSITFLFIIMPIVFFVIYFYNLKDANIKQKQKTIVIYAIWIASYLLFANVLFNFSISDLINRLLASASLLIPAVFGLMVVEFALEFSKVSSFVNKKYRIVYSAVVAVVLGILLLLLSGRTVSSIFEEVYLKLLNPFGGAGRLGQTVAENAQPYLNDWIGQTGQIVFWLFIFGMYLMGVQASKGISTTKHKIFFISTWILVISGVLFSRISSSSVLNGTNFISQIVYLGAILIFLAYFIWLYFEDKIKINSDVLIIIAWLFVMLLMGRAAQRTLFVAAPFVCFMASYFAVKIYEYARKAKDETLKYFLWAVTIISAILLLVSLFGNPATGNSGSYYAVSVQAQYIGPSTNSQWQEAMAWARNNTSPRDIFVHWWDYGYFVQSLANRPTVSDGGHAAGDSGDGNVGRYILTTPKPETALSYMKSWNASYLLIDPTDLGKYGAYSKIGGDKNQDRYSAPQPVVTDEKQTTETASGIKRVYIGTTFVDEDINYNGTFLPGPTYDKYELPTYKSYFLGIVEEYTAKNDSSSIEFKQPTAVFMYNNKQYYLPVRYMFADGRMLDFKTGIESVFMLIPSLTQDSSGGVRTDRIGAGIYLSPRVQKGLFARLYLMDDPYKQYPTIKAARVESDPVVNALKAQGIYWGEFIYYGGFRGPLEIWKVEYPLGTPTHSEFTQITSNWEGELDKFFN